HVSPICENEVVLRGLAFFPVRTDLKKSFTELYTLRLSPLCSQQTVSPAISSRSHKELKHCAAGMARAPAYAVPNSAWYRSIASPVFPRKPPSQSPIHRLDHKFFLHLLDYGKRTQ